MWFGKVKDRSVNININQLKKSNKKLNKNVE